MTKKAKVWRGKAKAAAAGVGSVVDMAGSGTYRSGRAAASKGRTLHVSDWHAIGRDFDVAMHEADTERSHSEP